jgi:hypothetical protein
MIFFMLFSDAVPTAETMYCKMRWDQDHECRVETDFERNGSVLLKFTQHASEECEKKLRKHLIYKFSFIYDTSFSPVQL